MKTRLFFIFFVSIVFASGCATKNAASNHDILNAINKQSEAITNLATAIRTPAPASTGEEITTTRKSNSSFGHALTAADLRPSNPDKKTTPDRTLLSTSNLNDSEKRFERIEKRVYVLEKIELKQNRRLDSLEEAGRKLALKISEIGLENFNNIIVGKFARGSKKLSKEIIGQTKAVAEKYNAYDDGNSHIINVTGFDDYGKVSEERGEAIRKILSQHLNKNLTVNLNREEDKKNYASCVVISNPFKR